MGHGLCDRSFIKKGVLYDTKPVMFCSALLLDDNSVLLERFLSDSEDDTPESSVHLTEHLMLKIRDFQKQQIFQRVDDKPQQPPRVLPRFAGDVNQHSSTDYNHS